MLSIVGQLSPMPVATQVSTLGLETSLLLLDNTCPMQYNYETGYMPLGTQCHKYQIFVLTTAKQRTEVYPLQVMSTRPIFDQPMT